MNGEHFYCGTSNLLTLNSPSSGDTGVSVSLVLQGKPPFKVFYQTKRDGEATRELSKTFHGSRGEIILQPERFDAFSMRFLSSILIHLTEVAVILTLSFV